MIKESYKDSFLIEVNKKTYEKIKDILYYEEEYKKQTLKNIDDLINAIYQKTNITYIKIEDVKNGYNIYYIINNQFHNAIFCYTLTEVIIYLRNFRR